MKTSCPRTDSLLSAFRSGALTGEAEEHRAGCPACAEALLLERVFRPDAERFSEFEREAVPGRSSAPAARGGAKPRPYTSAVHAVGNAGPLPDPGVIWRRAERDRRLEVARRVALPIVLVERAAWLVAATAAGLGLVVWAADLLGESGSTRAASPVGAPARELLMGVVVFLGLVAFAAYRDWVEAA